MFPLHPECQFLGNKCSLIGLTGSKINQRVHFKYHFQAITESPALMIIHILTRFLPHSAKNQHQAVHEGQMFHREQTERMKKKKRQRAKFRARYSQITRRKVIYPTV